MSHSTQPTGHFIAQGELRNTVQAGGETLEGAIAAFRQEHGCSPDWVEWLDAEGEEQGVAVVGLCEVCEAPHLDTDSRQWSSDSDGVQVCPSCSHLRPGSADQGKAGTLSSEELDGLFPPLPQERRRAVGPLTELGDEVNRINRANGWTILTPEDWDNAYTIPTALALIHSEVSEALEGFREGDRQNVAEELADVLIRVLNVADGLEINMDEEVSKKMEKNRHRGHRHGGKVV